MITPEETPENMVLNMLRNMVLSCYKCCIGAMLSGLTKALNQMNTQVLVRRKQTQRKSPSSVKDGRTKRRDAAFGSSKRITKYDSQVAF